MKNIKANRIFTKWREWAYIITLIISFGGLYEPKLGLLVIFIIIGLISKSFFKGRYWCGNVCPHGSLYDKVLLKYSKNIDIPNIFKSKPLLVVVFSIFGIKIVYRVYYVFNNFKGMDLLDKLGFIFVSTYIMVFIISSLIGILFAPRAWCQFCPMGTMQKISNSIGKIFFKNKDIDTFINIKDKDLCKKCGKCERVCPMQLNIYKEFDEDNKFMHKDCIKCSTCINHCPQRILILK